MEMSPLLTEKSRLTGHEAHEKAVTKVGHPESTTMVSSSEDAAIRKSNFDRGGDERTQNGHSASFLDKAFAFWVCLGEHLDDLMHKSLKFIPLVITVGLGLLGAGSWFYIRYIYIGGIITADNKICNSTSRTYDYELIQSIEYSKNCKKNDDLFCHTDNQTWCLCTIEQVLNVTQFLKGDIIIAYELESDKFFNRNGQDANKIRRSRDDQQLNGNLSINVSAACGEYSYDRNEPIAPCGALADAMFNDTIRGIYDNTGIVSPMLYNLLHPEQKIGFKNPPFEDLTAAFKNFTKPKSWSINVWELDKERPENNGFENEAFITWMSPNLNIRPMWRLNRSENPYTDGLPPGDYSVEINYRYPYSLYNGARKLNLYVEHPTEDPLCNKSVILTQQADSYYIGAAGVGIGVILLLASLALVLRAFKVTATLRKKSDQSLNNFILRTSTNHLPEDSTDNQGRVILQNKVMELEERFSLTGYGAPITKVIFHPESSWMVSSSEDATIKVWDCDSGELLGTLEGHTKSVMDIAFNQKGTLLASCSADKFLKLWDFDQNKPTLFECVTTIMHGGDHNVSSVAYSPSGDIVYSASETIKAWDVDTKHCMKTYEDPGNLVRLVHVSAAGLLASCDNDVIVRIWYDYDVSSDPKDCKTELVGDIDVLCVSWAPESAAAAIKKAANDDNLRGPFLACGCRDSSVKIWDVNADGKNRCVATLAGHTDLVRGVAWHPGGRYLLSASDDCTLRVWDVASASCVIHAHEGPVTCLDVHRSLPLVVSGSFDKTLKVWKAIIFYIK